MIVSSASTAPLVNNPGLYAKHENKDKGADSGKAPQDGRLPVRAANGLSVGENCLYDNLLLKGRSSWHNMSVNTV